MQQQTGASQHKQLQGNHHHEHHKQLQYPANEHKQRIFYFEI
jgi:hypothetical protein